MTEDPKKDIAKNLESQNAASAPLPDPAASVSGFNQELREIVDEAKKTSSAKGKMKYQDTKSSKSSKNKEERRPSKSREISPDIEKEASLKKGMLLGAYEILEPLSLSGLTETYLVLSRITRRKFILKLIPPLLSEIDFDFQNRFDIETAKLKSLIHPNIVSVKQTGHERRYYYMVMDYIDCPARDQETLDDRLSNGSRLPEVQALKIFMIICKALDYAHNCQPYGVVHSNLKPSNILIDRDNNLYIGDFSTVNIVGKEYFSEIVKHVVAENFSSLKFKDGPDSIFKETDLEKTASLVILHPHKTALPDFVKPIGDAMGRIFHHHKADRKKTFNPAALDEQGPISFRPVIESYDYMSPEQKAGHDATVRSNIYSAGLIFFHMLTGRKMTGKWILPSKFGVSKKWDRILVKCLQTDPLDRYSSMPELIHELTEVSIKKGTVHLWMGGLFSLFIIVLAALLFFSKSIGEWSVNVAFKPENISRDKSFSVKISPSPDILKIVSLSNGKMLRELKAPMPSKMDFELAPDEYQVLAEKDGFESLKTNICVTRDYEKNDFSFDFKRLPPPFEIKQYKMPASLEKPVQGFLWQLPWLDIQMIPIESGSVLCGADRNDKEREHDELLPMTAEIPYNFWIAKNEISQKAYELIMKDNTSFFKNMDSSLPAEKMTWLNAMQFCKNLTEHERAAGRLPASYIYRLPTEAEWEYCCRAGSESIYYFGTRTDAMEDYAWVSTNSFRRTHQTGKKYPNRWGLYDMLGNVSEWCLDIYGGEPLTPEFINLTKNIPFESSFVARGGSWNKHPEKNRCAARAILTYKTHKENNIGFRIVLGPEHITGGFKPPVSDIVIAKPSK